MAPPEVDDEQCELVGIAGVAATALETAPGGAVLHAAGPLIVAWTPGSDRRSCLRGHARAVAALALMHDGERRVQDFLRMVKSVDHKCNNGSYVRWNTPRRCSRRSDPVPRFTYLTLPYH